ncbi:deoxyribonuclease IV [Candidatus Similichlamydia laticola]|uniref:Probable endonuclease 4 n=1 Tax=Candidatus Similichlamydia laticola TaxID=2170265 RepID=A0A369KJX4_9BACT|nr:deoxyribonuclease IV [Candidatus Similichlamydia laticola]RDB31286.1 Endonuclease IV [Candidatus Similichlamydia laticola]
MLGAHCSASGGAHRACWEAHSIGADAVQFFTSNQRTWKARPPFSEEELACWNEAKSSCGIGCTVSHASYLINLGSEQDEVVHKSRLALKDEIVRCRALGVDFLVLHPGSSGSQETEFCLLKIVEGLLAVQNELLSSPKPLLLLESMAGQGSQVGKTFQQLAFLISRLSAHLPLSVCLDTCHVFASGQDIRSPLGLKNMLDAFDREIGLSHLALLHLNDSAKGLGSCLDRHASLGKGHIGWNCFEQLMKEERTAHLPKVLETPEGPAVWKEEIRRLKEVQHESKAGRLGT